ncbi:sigma-54-dependent Fis family transcriptional regulator [Pseudonocardia bannensis]|uniref:Fis family transcriptional regulator n=1 Tax=Pseudonocardia bannensis TaxID=630973 RepID=A0A848DFS8_9PSEU|nr:helix-turn-helix domain-containing protein [Pseudonocardia bannensis]NMH91425.1 Fis family transcriptional regulator [Pseudonocardia bannensis]
MDDGMERRLLVATARADFLSSGSDDLYGVPDHVAASWRRSASSGVRPHEVASVFHTELDLSSRLVRCARPIIERLSDEVADVPISVALTDNRARIVSRTDSNAWIGRLLDNVYFAQGFGYAEGSVGTNGVGTVLESGESVHIVGPEHFVESLQSFSCAGAPIRDPLSGRIEGVLDVSCLSDQSSPLMHSLVRSAARDIEHNLLLDRSQPQQALFDAYTRIDARCREAVLAVGQRVVMANTMMQTLLDLGDHEALQDHTRFLMARHNTVDDELDLPSGARVRLRGTRVTAGAEVAGMIVVVSVLAEKDRPVRLSGRYAAGAGHVPTRTGHPDTATLPRSTPPRRIGSVGGRTPAWGAAAADIEVALRAHDALLVLGEPGTGRFTLIAELYHLVHDNGRSIALHAEDINQASEDTIALLLRSDAAPTLYIMRDIDRLTEAAVDRLIDAIHCAPEPDSPIHLAATAAEAPPHDASYRALLPYFRASVTVPPLRHRGADIAALATAMLAELAPHRDVRLTRDALRLIMRYRWPGNVRQLKQALSAALSKRPVGALEAHDLPAFCHSTPRSTLRHVDEVERDAIVKALNDANGNRVAAAKALGLARSTLYRKIRHYGITR